MKIIKGNDYQILERLISLSQKTVKKTVSSFLKDKYPKVVETNDYIYAEGSIPIALVAHLDTVFEKDKEDRSFLYYDTRKGVMWNPNGAGFDDRAGVFAILKIIRDGYRPHVIFTTDEEIGAIGATILTEDSHKSPFKELKYVIELDRANEVDCVFYDCYNEEFIDFVEQYGFLEAWGTFSDIDVICSEWGIAGVNLSIGYKDEHTTSETLNVNAMFSTIKKVEKMLEEHEKAEFFKYIPSPYSYRHWWKNTAPGYDDEYMYYYGGMTVKCAKCGQFIDEWESIPVKQTDGGTKYYCCDCIADQNVGWCYNCGEAYEKDADNNGLCKDCRGNAKWLGKKSKINLKK